MVVAPPLVTGGGTELARYFSHEYALDPTAPHGTAKVLRGGQPELIRAMDDDTLREIAADDEDLKKLRQLAPTSYLAVPLRTKGRNVGALVLVSTNPRATFDEDDLSAAEDLASCAALVLSGAHDVADSRLMEPELGPATTGHQHPEDPEAFATQAEPGIVAPDASMDDLRATLRGLTERQLEILRLLAEHHTPKTIARRLVISEKTVRRHVERINQNLGVNSYREAVLKAKSLRIVI
jgi:DNA-binding CsgD family transcriptional regulator